MDIVTSVITEGLEDLLAFADQVFRRGGGLQAGVRSSPGAIDSPAEPLHSRPVGQAFLGIDVGTSKTAAVIVDGSGRTVATGSMAHAADVPAGRGLSEQDPALLLESARSVVAGLPAAARQAVAAVGLTGQMHGVLLLDKQGSPVGPLVTWQDGRCSQEFLADLRARTGFQLRTGFGCATLAAYAAAGRLPAAASHAATIHDWITAFLCGLARPVTDPTDAASWGLFDLATLRWDVQAVKNAGIPPDLLPAVVACGEVAGRVTPGAAARFGIPPGIPVTAAMGDNQASLIATMADPEKELALTLGTGGQLSAVLPASDTALLLAEAPREAGAPWEFRPYPGGRLLAAGASLCGGSAWQWLAVTVEKVQEELGLPRLPRDRLYARLGELAAAAPRADASGVVVHPNFLGERHAPLLRGSIEGITLDNLSLGTLARSLAESITANLRDMLPARFREGRARVVASGNALERNPVLRQAASEALGLPVTMGAPPEAAAVGAALTARAATQGGARACASFP